MTTTAKEKLQRIIRSPEFQTYYKERTLVTDLAVKIKMTREKLGWTQEFLAKKMNVPQSSVARMESGTEGISTTTLEKFCNATGTKLEITSLQLNAIEADPVDVCKYILETSETELGDAYDVSNMKLHKLLYFCQKESFEKYNIPLMTNLFEAWEHGPVHKKMYHVFKSCNNNPIPKEACSGNNSCLTKEQKKIIDSVLTRYIYCSAWQLREKTHEEPHYKKAWSKGKNTPIVFE